MAEFPALPLFTDAYLSDTRHLSAAQHGAYLLLLMMAWRTPDCALPDDDDMLCRWACMDRRTWQRNKPVVMAFWTLNGNKWQQKRLVDERQYVVDLRIKKSAAGQASALKRNNRHLTPVQQKSNRSAVPTPTPIKKEEGKPSSPPNPQLPDWLDPVMWDAFREMRKGNKSPMTAFAEKSIIQRLDRFRATGHDPTAVMEQCIRNNWKDVYEIKDDHNGNTQRYQPQQPKKSQFQLAVEATERARAARERGGEE